MRHHAWFVSAALLVSTAALAGPEIKLEGSGDARAKLDALSFKAFDAALLTDLSSWTGGDALTVAEMTGKPVMFVTFSSWYKTSHEALRMAQSIHAKHAAEGLLVVGVHHKEGWGPKATDLIESSGVQFRTVHDKNNGFRKALFCTQDPDFYFVDRAGRLRFADVQTGSAEAAAALLVAESVEQAARAAAPSPGAAPAATADSGGEASASFAPPPASAYAAAKWPAKNPSVSHAKDFQGKPMPKPLGSEQKYVDGKAPDRTGKVTVVDFWATWCGPCIAVMPKLDQMQSELKDDAVFIGISDEPEAKVKAFLKKKPHGYAQAVDTGAAAKRALGIQGIPHVVILSSDGVVRWQGNPHSPSFETTVKAVIAADPGVKARQATAKK